MTTELLVLLFITLFVLFGVFWGPQGLKVSFDEASPKLGARMERYIETGASFVQASQATAEPISWGPPPMKGGQ